VPKAKPKTNAYQKLVAKNENQRKLDLLTEFALSINAFREACEEDNPWTEFLTIDNKEKEFVFKRVQNISSFGVIHLEFEELYNCENKVTLSLQLQLKKI